MKKRIRKKKHLGEFEKYGILIKFDITENEIEDVTDFVNDFADAHDLYSWGGGYGRFSMQHVKDNYDVPTVVVEIIRAITNGMNDKPLFCLYSPDSLRVPEETLVEITSVFDNSTYKASIAPKQIRLWNL